MSLRPSSPEEARERRKKRREWRRRSVEKYEERLKEEGKKFSDMERTGGLRPVNPERREKRYERDFGDKADWIRGLCCLVCGMKPAEPHHYPTRAAGGTKKDLTPLCKKHHRMFHDLGAETWQERFGIDLKAAAERLEERWKRKQSSD